MLSHILLSWQQSDHAEQLLPYIAGLALALNAEVTLLRFLDKPSGAPNHFVDPLQWHIQETEAEVGSDKLVRRLQDLGVHVQKGITQDSGAIGIISYAQDHGVELIAIANAGAAISEPVHQIMTHSPMPLFILRVDGIPIEAAAPMQYHKLLAPLDASQRAEAALPLATALAKACDAQLILTHIVRKPEMPRRTSPSRQDIELAERLVESNRRASEEYLKGLVERLSVETQIRLLVSEDVAATLHNLTNQESIDLIILSAHGNSGNPQWSYGSITNSIIAYSAKPVLVFQDLPIDIPASSVEAMPRENRIQ